MTVAPVRLLVDDFYGCFHFLQDSLGLECTSGNDDTGYASFKARVGSFAELAPGAYAAVTELRAARDGALTVVEVEDVDAEAARLVDDLIGRAAAKAAWGGRVAYVRDARADRG